MDLSRVPVCLYKQIQIYTFIFPIFLMKVCNFFHLHYILEVFPFQYIHVRSFERLRILLLCGCSTVYLTGLCWWTLVCFYSFHITGSATVIIHKHMLFYWGASISVSSISRCGIARSKEVCIDNFDNIAKLPSVKVIPIDIPMSSIWGCFSTALLAVCC